MEHLNRILRFGIIVIVVLSSAGCFSRSKPAYLVEQYTLEYQPPAVSLGALNETVKIERFSVNQSFNSQAMIYKPDQFRLAAYNYHKWRVNPGDMVTDYFLRDLRNTNIFRAVFSYHNVERSRFVVEGGLEQFLEEAHNKELKAILSVNIALLDTRQNEIAEKIMFQKQYNFKEPIKEHSPEEFARGMSTNMSRFSGQLTKDLHNIIGAKIRAPEKELAASPRGIK